MWREKTTNLAISRFITALQNSRILLLYPQVTYRAIFISYLLEASSDQLLYYRLTPSNTTLSDMLNGLIDEAQNSFPEFGKNTRAALSKANPNNLAKALSQDLADFGDAIILYLDELDYLDLNDDYRSFFATLATSVPDNARLVINARELTTEPWKEIVVDGNASVVGTERRSSQLMFTPDNADKPQLEIYGFGRGHAIVNGLVIESWDGALPRNLFFYFIDKDLVTRSEIFDVFWSDLNVKEATNVFHVTKRKISERIALNVLDDDGYELTKYSNGFYRPSDKIIRYYDVAEFEAAIEEATTTFDDDDQAELYRRALGIYRAPFLLSLDMPWVHERREKLQRQLMEALIGLARIYKSTNRKEESLGYFLRALREKPLREDIHREVMRLYAELGYPQEAERQYQHLETLLQEMLGVSPGPETKALLAEIQQ